MRTGSLHNGVEQEASPASPQIPAEPDQPAYLSRLANLPDRPDPASPHDSPRSVDRAENTRIDQIEHALTILASVVARLAKEAQQSRNQLRASEIDPNLVEDRRVQKELVRSLQARLAHVEDRVERQGIQQDQSALTNPPDSADLLSIRTSLSALLKRRARPAPPPA